MAKISKAIIDKALRDGVFHDIFENDCGMFEYVKINDRQYGALLTDMNGHERYVRIGVIVAEERDDMTARELMKAEQTAYQNAQEQKAEKARLRAEKAEKDKARREKEKEGE